MNAAFSPASSGRAQSAARIRPAARGLLTIMSLHRPRRGALTLKTVLIAVMAAAALLGAAFIAVPSTGEGAHTCMGLMSCVGF